jgi:NADH-quinone oxidoreductase subunit G
MALPLSQASAIVVISTTLPEWARRADVVLPIANMAEEEGTFTNLRGRVQRYLQAKAAPALVRPGWSVVSDLLNALGDPTVFFLPADVFATLATARPAFAGLSYDHLGLRGDTVAGAAGTQPAAAGAAR